MTEPTAPTFGMPTLSSGSHSPYEGQACVMEYISLLAGEAWSDRPTCTHPILSQVARIVNDHLSDLNRYRLIPLIGRLFGTSAPADQAEAARICALLADWAGRQVGRSDTYHVLSCKVYVGHTFGKYRTLLQVHPGVLDVVDFVPDLQLDAEIAAHHATMSVVSANPDLGVEFLTGLLDEYDRITGRTILSTADLAHLDLQVARG